ncbi:UDP-N-acetylmuramoyl-L-alanyl-D-glutamate--2,6-diaminopimelate ligase [Clostridium perfringens]|uniref:UDP-N-acetylmuramoyl-L-alanyl-D-glutamate--2,6-diaminopimelate ligase n=1 Tax=Clostridium perfringens (strain SM101 / Type A) TaxID=289380 RepID=Q0SRW2_CLOPS|nr:UDP-N-acetylmuramoyl-L-alanyl-D-glutamate--2,6-diaminopimelate ligase [Clostridium perfringens]ABG87670.1 UDP-N-acetylmuramoylalanyl-D-glutamate--2,6-diaminopimelate ligase [Clostridium perfringens SM101]EJT5925199.1 UDP-N-acetylmuramoyl-L-alanyl-D-glutamate--2,6-diaminopimelate ligase [Clostridium perfringens]EJT6149754.1 UDP-N-acetylmuramoyl-L-alanyl-D-glutamate--2,6-diaminopimelate ligase [Clostridium perfringens]EJT6155159.1 UDP-N-acetylmuramoyl-L-alanyl-D-glutamate--2,6-diaminopimelate 
MILKSLLKGLDYEVIKGNEESKVQNIRYDNRKIEQGDAFVCVKGFKVDGHSFIGDAIKKGAKTLIVQEDVSVQEDITIIKVRDTRKALAIMSSNYFGNPKDKLKIIGITGTNGKTTSAFIIKSILEKAGFMTGLIGTIANYIGNKKVDAVRTTPESYELHELFKNMVDAGVEYCVMEVSSHSLELDRVYGIQFEEGIFTNLTRDHLDFHKTFENYYNAKFKLFERSNHSIINLDDPYGANIVKDIEERGVKTKVSTFSIEKESDFKAFEIKSHSNGSEFKVNLEEVEDFSINIPGEYNVYNSLGCIICAYNLNIPMNKIKEGLSDVVIPGRCELVAKEKNLPYSIIIDYAHTPDGLENILSTVKAFTRNRMISVFGCGGDRDKVKRPQMGKIGCELSDIAIITSDNPRSEEPMDIINDIVKPLNYDNFVIEVNRKEAIRKAMNMALEGDVIVIAGKGHETYQILKDETIHFDEREVVYDILEGK